MVPKSTMDIPRKRPKVRRKRVDQAEKASSPHVGQHIYSRRARAENRYRRAGSRHYRSKLEGFV